MAKLRVPCSRVCLHIPPPVNPSRQSRPTAPTPAAQSLPAQLAGALAPHQPVHQLGRRWLLAESCFSVLRDIPRLMTCGDHRAVCGGSIGSMRGDPSPATGAALRKGASCLHGLRHRGESGSRAVNVRAFDPVQIVQLLIEREA